MIYLVSATSVPWAETQYDDVADVLLFALNIQTVSSVTITNQGTDTIFKLEHFPDEKDTEKNLKVTVDGKQLNTKQFRNLYQVMDGNPAYRGDGSGACR